MKFLVCEHCGNLIGMIRDSGVPMVCCGQKMTELRTVQRKSTCLPMWLMETR